MTAAKPLPPHGTYARANGRFYADIPPCGCTPCRDAEFRYDKQRRVDKAAGRERIIPAKQAAADVEYLAARGMAYLDIAAAARCSKASIYALRKPGARITVGLAARISAVRFGYSGTKPVPAFGAVRRVRGAVAAGHPQSAIAAEAGLPVSYISELVNEKFIAVYADTHDRIDQACRTLLAGPAPTGVGAVRSRNRARAAGWPTLEQWEDRIDDPDADPTVWRRSGTVDVAGLVEDAEWLHKQTGSWETVATQLGVAKDTLHQYRTRVRRRTEQELAA